MCNPEEGDSGEEARRQEGDRGEEDHREEARRQEGDSGEEARCQKACSQEDREVSAGTDECKRRVMPAFFFTSQSRRSVSRLRTYPVRGFGQIPGDMVGRYDKLSFMPFAMAGEQIYCSRAGVSAHFDVVRMVTNGERAR